MTLFIVEDFYGMRHLMSRVANQLGFTVTCADSGEEAIRIVKSGYRPKYVILDINLSDHLTGLDVLDEIHGFLPNTRFAIVSREIKRPLLVKAYSLGVKDFLVKPYDPVDFEKLLVKFKTGTS